MIGENFKECSTGFEVDFKKAVPLELRNARKFESKKKIRLKRFEYIKILSEKIFE